MSRLAAIMLCVGVLCLSAALRFHLLGAQSLWNDEGNAYVQASRSFPDIAFHAGRDIHPPGYYWLLAIWSSLVGQTEFALRLLSALLSVLTIAFTYALGARLFGRAAGVVAALFVTLNTFNLYYAQEARMYALLALWGAGSMWALVCFQQMGFGSEQAAVRRRYLILLALFNAAGLYTHYAYVYVMLVQSVLVSLWLMARVWRHGERLGYVHVVRHTVVPYVIANLLTIAMFLPWLPTAWQQITTWPNTGQDIALAEAVSVILNRLILGVTSQNGSLAVAWLLLLFGLINRPRAAWWALLVPVIWVTTSVGLFLGQGLFRESNLKFLLPAQIGMALWLSRGVWVLSYQIASLGGRCPAGRASRLLPAAARLAGAVSVLWIAAHSWAGVQAVYHDPRYQRDDYRAIARLIGQESQIGDLVVLNGPNQVEVFDYYYRGRARVIGLPLGLGSDDAATARAVEQAAVEVSQQPDRPYARVYGVFWGERERDPNQIVEGFLDRNLYSMGDGWYGSVRLARYLQPTSAWSPISADLNARFYDPTAGTQIRLVDGQYDDTAVPGGAILVRLVWRSEGDVPISQPYKVFVQILDSNGLLVTQHDGEPGGNAAPTTGWQAGTAYDDRHALLVPAGLAAGNYQLIVGLYALGAPNARLRVEGDARDYLEVGVITVRST
jgi:4-amino-4-deoxy-L-arabinose transferase-like glycosyltransferase